MSAPPSSEGKVSDAEAARYSELVRSPGPWRDAYREAVARLARETCVRSHRLCDPLLDEALVAAEKALSPHESAVLLLDDEHYRSVTDGHDVDPAAWWGLPERMDRVSEASLAMPC